MLTRASNLWSEARFTYPKFHPRYGMGDMGYSSKELFRLIRNQYRAQPVIDINPRHKALLAQEAGRHKTPEWKALYKQRTGVERAFARLKGNARLITLLRGGCERLLFIAICL